MREIKFRARHSISGDWYYGCSNPDFLLNELDLSLFFLQLESGVLDAKTVGQYTGLHDKNGKEIYAGDIVKEVGSYQSGTYHWELIYRVECDAPNGGFNLRDSERKYVDLLYQDLEVIGNIYENPELLEAR